MARISRSTQIVYTLQVRNGRTLSQPLKAALPQPSMSFRRRAWLQFQRALDPLAQPKPLKIERH
jgi:hypothetical protein